MFKLQVNRMFDASHQLPDSDDLITKACARYHGHTYFVKVFFDSKKNKRHGMVVDFKGIKNIIDILDHQFINNIFRENRFYVPATAENIAKFLYLRIHSVYKDLKNLEVAVCEGYKGEENSSWAIYYE